LLKKSRKNVFKKLAVKENLNGKCRRNKRKLGEFRERYQVEIKLLIKGEKYDRATK